MQDEFGFIWEMEERHSSTLERAINLAKEEHFDEALKLIEGVLQEVQELKLPPDGLYLSFGSPVEFVVASIRWELGQLPWNKEQFKNIYWLPLPVAVTYFLKAYILEEMNEIKGAMESLHKALEWNPIHGESYLELAYIYNNFLQEPEPALKFCVQGLENAFSPFVISRGYNYLGETLMNLGDFEGAEAAYHKALFYNPDDELAKEQLEVISRFKPTPSTDGSLESCDRILEARNLPTKIHPHFAQAFTILAKTLMDGGEYEAAVEYYKQALDIEPNLPSAHAGLALAYRALGQLDLAKKHAEIAEELEQEQAE